jgi:hypothetical protein
MQEFAIANDPCAEIHAHPINYSAVDRDFWDLASAQHLARPS